MCDNSPRRVLLQEVSHRRKQAETAIFATLPERDSVMQGDPPADTSGVQTELEFKLLSGVQAIDQQEVALDRLDVSRVADSDIESAPPRMLSEGFSLQ
jgi:hypothetical protein